jgi:Tol biopolymer transport system component
MFVIHPSKFFRVMVVVGAAVLVACVLALVGTARPAEAAFPGANGKIAFEGDSGIFVTDRNMSTDDEARLSDSSDSEPAWSPDGQRIAFVRNQGGGDTDIYVMDADSSTDDAVNISNDISNDTLDEDLHPAWSPDGQDIAFMSDPGDGQNIYIMDTDPSTDDEVLISDPSGGAEYDPDWSPDGRKIAFVGNQDGNNEIYVMDTDPSTDDAIKITKTAFNGSWDPDWSPDGRKITFARGSCAYGCWSSIAVMNRDGSGLKKITQRTCCGTDSDPVWSPDGRKIAFARQPRRSPYYNILVMNNDGTGRKKITNDGHNHYAPDWQPIVP